MLRKALVVTVLVALVLPAGALGGPPGTWTRIQAGNAGAAEPGLARTADGALHVVWQRASGPLREELVHQAISPAGALLGSSTLVAQGWQAINPHVELVAAGAGLRAFWAGLTAGPLSGPIVTAASTGGATWGVPAAVTAANTMGAGAPGIGAAVTPTGTVVAAQGDAVPGANMFHVGVGGGADVTYETGGCCAYHPDVAVDGVSGQLVLGWFSNAAGRRGVWTQEISASGLVGTPAQVPGSSANNGASAVEPSQRTAIIGRIAAGGVYVAYGSGFPAFGSVNLLRVGGSPVLVARGSRIEHVGIAAAPEGRLWLFWSRGDEYVATRSNRKATRFGTATKISLPADEAGTYGLYGEGSLGPLDLIAHAGSGSAIPDWHTQVLPRLSLVVTAKSFLRRTGGSERTFRRLMLRVTDAGDAVRGARVTVAGRSLTTSLLGKATVVLPSTGKRAAVKATKAGYTPVSTRVSL
jgi:hypothetical protein